MEQSIKISQKASDELKSLLEGLDMKDTDTLRIFISGMACNGPMFNVAKDSLQENDYEYDFDGIKYVADKALIDEFGGFEIQYIEQDGFHGLFVKPDIEPMAGGCATCAGSCH